MLIKYYQNLERDELIINKNNNLFNDAVFIPETLRISELQMVGYRGVMSIEHEDPTMSQMEGLRQAKDFMDPIVLRDPAPDGPRWW